MTTKIARHCVQEHVGAVLETVMVVAFTVRDCKIVQEVHIALDLTRFYCMVLHASGCMCTHGIDDSNSYEDIAAQPDCHDLCVLLNANVDIERTILA